MDRLIFHVDVNSAFLSWEAVYRLRYLNETVDLRTVPSAVGGDRESRRGIILASSMPAKKLGVRTPEPIVDALRKCPDLILVAPRFDFYTQCSTAFMDILREYTDLVEPCSIDEASVDMSEVAEARRDPAGFADMLRNRIRDELGFTVNIGVSVNRLLAKMASDFTKPDRMHTLFPEEIPAKMWPLPVGNLMFVGGSTVSRLANLGIHTIGDLANTDPAILSSYMGRTADGLIRSANGIDDTPVTLVHEDNKGYSCSTTLPDNLTTADEAYPVLLGLCESVCTRLRKHNAMARTLSVSIRDGAFDKSSRQATLDNATNITIELYTHACELFDAHWNGHPIRALGIHASNVTDGCERQYSFFDTTDYSKQEKADKVVDALRERFGKGIVVRASLLKPSGKKKPEEAGGGEPPADPPFME